MEESPGGLNGNSTGSQQSTSKPLAAKVLNCIIKVDVGGSLEAIKKEFDGLPQDEISLSLVSSGVGVISESDIFLAQTTNAVVFGFNVALSTKMIQLSTFAANGLLVDC